MCLFCTSPGHRYNYTHSSGATLSWESITFDDDFYGYTYEYTYGYRRRLNKKRGSTSFVRGGRHQRGNNNQPADVGRSTKKSATDPSDISDMSEKELTEISAARVGGRGHDESLAECFSGHWVLTPSDDEYSTLEVGFVCFRWIFLGLDWSYHNVVHMECKLN